MLFGRLAAPVFAFCEGVLSANIQSDMMGALIALVCLFMLLAECVTLSGGCLVAASTSHHQKDTA